MRNKDSVKTLGPRESKLISSMYDNNKVIFKINDVKAALNISELAAANMVSRLNAKGILTRLKQGLYSIVPFELGTGKTYVPDAFLTAREIMGSQEYYISYASALAIHEMTTQPQLTTYVCSQKTRRPQNASGNRYRFVFTKKDFFFGIEDSWITKQEKVKVSDREKTIVDCLNHPDFCGGVTEAAKALYMKRDILDSAKLIEYSLRMKKGSVNSRLGYLMELYGMAGEKDLKQLKDKVNSSYVVLDPMLPKEGKYLNRWMLFLNVPQEELKNIGRT